MIIVLHKCGVSGVGNCSHMERSVNFAASSVIVVVSQTISFYSQIIFSIFILKLISRNMITLTQELF